jgi:hypothetical protein
MSQVIKEEENLRTDMQRLKVEEGVELYYPLYRSSPHPPSLSIADGQNYSQLNTSHREPGNTAIEMVQQRPLSPGAG